MVKKCIIFDNEDQSDEIVKLIRDGRNQGIAIECEQFNVGSTEYTEVLTKGEIDISKVISEYKRRFSGITFHLAVFDWDLNDEKINGIELIRQLNANRILYRTPKIVISALLKSILADIVKSDEQKRIKQLTLLVNSNIIEYHEREKYEQDIINYFSKNEESLDLILEEEFKKFPKHIFRNSFSNKNFNGKTFLEIAEFLESADKIRNDFKKELIHQVLAYLTEKI